MATLSNPTYFADGSTENALPRVGYYTQNRVVRYDLTLEKGESADHISFTFRDSASGAIEMGGGVGETPDAFAKKQKLFFVISTSPTEFINAGYFDRHKATGQLNMVYLYDISFKATWEGDVYLYPGVNYYFYVFPGYSNAEGGDGNYGYWKWGRQLDITLTLSGSAGSAHIDISPGNARSILYIDTGTKIKRIIPYMDTGTEISVVT
jgi:hypothetical protein